MGAGTSQLLHLFRDAFDEGLGVNDPLKVVGGGCLTVPPG
jgi:hypothetical protein